MDFELRHSLFGSGKAAMTRKNELQSRVTDRRFRGRIPPALLVKRKLMSNSDGRTRFQSVTEDIGFHGLRLDVSRQNGTGGTNG